MQACVGGGCLGARCRGPCARLWGRPRAAGRRQCGPAFGAAVGVCRCTRTPKALCPHVEHRAAGGRVHAHTGGGPRRVDGAHHLIGGLPPAGQEVVAPAAQSTTTGVPRGRTERLPRETAGGSGPAGGTSVAAGGASGGLGSGDDSRGHATGGCGAGGAVWRPAGARRRRRGAPLGPPLAPP